MKNLIVILLVISGMTAWATEQGSGHNPTETAGPCSMTTECIAPFTVENDQAYAPDPDQLPDVIKGQIWEETPVTYAIFHMTKAPGYTVKIKLKFDDNPVGGVKLFGTWDWNDTPPPWSGSFPIKNKNFTWHDAQTEGWVKFSVTKIDATNATTTGVRSFNVSISGNYINL